MYVNRETVAVTTAADGSATEYSVPVTGRLISIQYVKDDFVNGVVISISGETTGRTFWLEVAVNASVVKAPRQTTHLNSDGSQSTYDGSERVDRPFVLDNERIKIIIGSGGNAKNGTFHFTIA